MIITLLSSVTSGAHGDVFTSSPEFFPKNKRQMRGDSWYQLVLWQLYERVSFWSKVV